MYPKCLHASVAGLSLALRNTMMMMMVWYLGWPLCRALGEGEREMCACMYGGGYAYRRVFLWKPSISVSICPPSFPRLSRWTSARDDLTQKMYTWGCCCYYRRSCFCSSWCIFIREALRRPLLQYNDFSYIAIRILLVFLLWERGWRSVRANLSAFSGSKETDGSPSSVSLWRADAYIQTVLYIT